MTVGIVLIRRFDVGIIAKFSLVTGIDPRIQLDVLKDGFTRQKDGFTRQHGIGTGTRLDGLQF